MLRSPGTPTVVSAILPPWGWSRRELISRSAQWFAVVPRTFKPELIELARALARSGQQPGVSRTLCQAGVDPDPFSSVKWPITGLRLFGEQMLEELIAGSGLVYVVGLCSSENHLSDEVLRWIYRLIGLQLGSPVSDDSLMLDIGSGNACTRRETALHSPHHSETAFHTDSAPDGSVPDLVGTLCLWPAKEGGEYQVCSALRAREMLFGRCRELLDELHEPFIRDEPHRRRPVYAYEKGSVASLRFDYARPGIETGYQRAEVPLRPSQQLALDRLDEALNDPAGCMQFQMKRGDMLFVNNHLVAHNRRPYVDGGRYARRLVVRMWLSTPEMRQPAIPS